MYQNRQRNSTAATSARPTSQAVTITIRPMTAKHPENQEALDRMNTLRIRAEQNPNSKFVFTIKRAMKSLQECNHPITTLKQALALKNVGDRLAKLIVPPTQNKELPQVPTNPRKNNVVASTRPPMAKGATSSSTATTTTTTTASTFNTTARAPSNSTSTVSSRYGYTPASTTKEDAYEAAKMAAEKLVLPPNGQWRVILLVDTRERNSRQVVARIKQSGIPCEERQLPIGDMVWIARCTQEPRPTPTSTAPTTSSMSRQHSTKDTDIEILLGTIMERKEISDLASSIFGTRYMEQRLRLQQCGLPQVLYLIEGDVDTPNANCSTETLRSAMMEIRIHSGFSVFQTKHMQDSVQLLKGLHRRVVQRTFPTAFSMFDDDKDDKNNSTNRNGQELPTFSSPPPHAAAASYPRTSASDHRPRKRQRRPTSLLEMVFDSTPQPPFSMKRFMTYMELKAKVERDRQVGTRTVGAVYTAMLKQVPSLSQKKCLTVAAKYPTLSHLMRAYHGDGIPNDSVVVGCSSHPVTQEVQNLRLVGGCQKVGPKSAAELFVACCTPRNGPISTICNARGDPAATSHNALSKNPYRASSLQAEDPVSGRDDAVTTPPTTTPTSTISTGNDTLGNDQHHALGELNSSSCTRGMDTASRAENANTTDDSTTASTTQHGVPTGEFQSQGSNSYCCFDLTQDTPPVKERAISADHIATLDAKTCPPGKRSLLLCLDSDEEDFGHAASTTAQQSCNLRRDLMDRCANKSTLQCSTTRDSNDDYSVQCSRTPTCQKDTEKSALSKLLHSSPSSDEGEADIPAGGLRSQLAYPPRPPPPRQPRTSTGSSSALFSSPGTTATGGLQLSQDSSFGDNRNAKGPAWEWDSRENASRLIEKRHGNFDHGTRSGSINNNASNSGSLKPRAPVDVSIVVIDSSDDEDDSAWKQSSEQHINCEQRQEHRTVHVFELE